MKSGTVASGVTGKTSKIKVSEKLRRLGQPKEVGQVKASVSLSTKSTWPVESGRRVKASGSHLACITQRYRMSKGFW